VSALADADRTRLARLLGMLGSDFNSEVAHAGRRWVPAVNNNNRGAAW
jgi:hypothetical protein